MDRERFDFIANMNWIDGPQDEVGFNVRCRECQQVIAEEISAEMYQDEFDGHSHWLCDRCDAAAGDPDSEPST